jgi:DnaJ-class molecular chaperone
MGEAEMTFLVTCDDCGGEGGFYSAVPSYGHAYSDPTPGERWDECPTCHGSGWLDNHEPEPEIDQDELPPPRDEPDIIF